MLNALHKSMRHCDCTRWCLYSEHVHASITITSDDSMLESSSLLQLTMREISYLQSCPCSGDFDITQWNNIYWMHIAQCYSALTCPVFNTLTPLRTIIICGVQPTVQHSFGYHLAQWRSPTVHLIHATGALSAWSNSPLWRTAMQSWFHENLSSIANKFASF